MLLNKSNQRLDHTALLTESLSTPVSESCLYLEHKGVFYIYRCLIFNWNIDSFFLNSFRVFLKNNPIHESRDTCSWAYVVTQSFLLQSGEPRPILAAERLSLSRTPISSPIMMQTAVTHVSNRCFLAYHNFPSLLLPLSQLVCNVLLASDSE